MTCTGRYAEAWEYGAFWCVGSIVAGVDDSGGAANPSLSDAQAQFINWGIKANEGMVLYNTTQGTSGTITAVTPTALTATGVTWDNADGYHVVNITGIQIATIEHYLNITAANIHAARAASNQCDCALAGWAADHLSKINIIEAGAFHNCSCAQPGQRMSDEERRMWLEWSNTQLENIRTSKIALCDGQTGSEYPSLAWAEMGLTGFSRAQIIANRINRQGS